MKPICRSKTFQKGEDYQNVSKFFLDHAEYEIITFDDPLDSLYVTKYKTIITITKVVEESETKIDEG